MEPAPRVRCRRRFCSALEVLAVSLSVWAPNSHVPEHDQTHSNACICLGFSCILLVGIALGDLENCLKFIGTDQDVRMCFGCLLSTVKSRFANSLNLKGHR